MFKRLFRKIFTIIGAIIGFEAFWIFRSYTQDTFESVSYTHLHCVSATVLSAKGQASHSNKNDLICSH